MTAPLPDNLRSAPRFAGAERRSFAVPIMLALVLIVAALVSWTRVFPRSVVTVEAVRVDVVPIRTVFKSNSIVVGPAQTQVDLYVATTLRIHNPLKVPVTVDDVTCTLTDHEGAESMVSAESEQDLTNVWLSFPQLKPLTAGLALRERTVQPEETGEGVALFHFALPMAMWETRRSAQVKVDFYHRESVSVTLPREAKP